MRFTTSLGALAALSLAGVVFMLVPTRAANVIVNGGLEDGAGPANWTLTQSTAPTPPLGDFNSNNVVDAADYILWRKNLNTSNPLNNDNHLGTPIGPSHYALWRSNFGNTQTSGLPVAAVELLSDAQEPPTTTGLGLLVHPAAGNNLPYLNQNLPISFSLTQTFVAGPSAPGKSYTFSGDSTYQGAYSGNIDTLYPDSPSGAIPSPTQTQFQMTFLSSTDVPLGTSILNLPKHRVDTGTPVWQKDSLSAVAPPNTFKVQVTVSATNMVASCTSACPFGQDVRFDNFSLKDTTITEHLLNPTLDQVGVPSGWTLQTVGNDAVQFSNADFARHGGNVGMWLRAFRGNDPNPPANNPGPVDAVISQLVAGTPGTPYSFSAWAKLQQGYSGLDPSSGTQTFLKMEFLDGTGTPIPGTTASLELGPNGPLGPNFWPPGPDNGQGVYQQVSIPTTIAPAGTVNIRVSGGATGMINEPVAVSLGLAQSAMFDDFSLLNAGSGSGNLLSGALAASVPEPATSVLVLVALACGFGIRPRRVASLQRTKKGVSHAIRTVWPIAPAVS